VANHASAEKRNRQRITRTARNKARTSAVRTFVKKVRAAITAKDGTAATEALRTAISELDRAAVKGVIHRSTASRTIGRLSAAVAKLGKA
jgi:small subunit ribosomal protein S20